MKTIVLTLCFASFISSLVLSQIPVKEWDYRYGGNGYDAFSSIVKSGNGYVLGGYSNSAAGGDVTDNKVGGYDYWIVQIDTNGQELWDYKYGALNQEYIGATIQTSDGNFLTGGYSTSDGTGDKTQDNYGQPFLGRDIWTIKTDANGNKLWDRALGGNGSEIFTGLIKSPGGGFIIAGYSNSGVGFDKSESSQGNFDYWVVKLDENGEEQWDETVGGPGVDVLKSVIATSDGGYLLGGYSSSHAGGDKSQDNYGSSTDYWIVKLDHTGNKVWDKRFGGSGNDYLEDVIETSDGGYLVGGNSYSPTGQDKTEGSQGLNDFWIIKLNHAGEKIWDAAYGGSSKENGCRIIEVSDGYILGGNSSSGISGDKTQPAKGGYDMWIVKTDFYGNKIWDVSFGTSSDEGVSDMLLTADNGLLLGGSTSGADGDKTQDSRGIVDYWIIKTSPVTGLEQPLRQKVSSADEPVSSFRIDPNPFSSSATITFSLNELSQVSIKLFSADGKKLMTIADENFAEGSHEFNFTNESLGAGVYFLQLQTSSSTVTKKIVVE